MGLAGFGEFSLLLTLFLRRLFKFRFKIREIDTFANFSTTTLTTSFQCLYFRKCSFLQNRKFISCIFYAYFAYFKIPISYPIPHIPHSTHTFLLFYLAPQ